MPPAMQDNQISMKYGLPLKAKRWSECLFSPMKATPEILILSQLTVRGHYDTPALAPYFRAMMWLGRTDFFLTKPPDMYIVWGREDIRRMTAGALLPTNS